MAFDKFPHPKDPSETLTYTRDFATLVGIAAVSNPTATCADDDLVIDNVVLLGKAVICLVSGGIAGTDYRIVFGIEFGDDGENYERTVVLRVRER